MNSTNWSGLFVAGMPKKQIDVFEGICFHILQNWPSDHLAEAFIWSSTRFAGLIRTKSWQAISSTLSSLAQAYSTRIPGRSKPTSVLPRITFPSVVCQPERLLLRAFLRGLPPSATSYFDSLSVKGLNASRITFGKPIPQISASAFVFIASSGSQTHGRDPSRSMAQGRQRALLARGWDRDPRS